MSRQCHPCTACCQGWLKGEIEGFRMKPGRPCLHCTESGCGIYERRPVNPCRTFNCGWVIESSPLPEHFKPTECDTIISLNHSWKGMKVHYALATKKVVPKHVLDFMVAYAHKTQVPLVWTENQYRRGMFQKVRGHGYGPPDFINRVKMYIEANKGLPI